MMSKDVETRVRALNPPKGADLATWHALHQTVLHILLDEPYCCDACRAEGWECPAPCGRPRCVTEAATDWVVNRVLDRAESAEAEVERLRETGRAQMRDACLLSEERHRRAEAAEAKLNLIRGLLAAYGEAEGTPVDYEFLVHHISEAIECEWGLAERTTPSDSRRARELRDAARYFVNEMAETWGGDAQWLTTGRRVAEVVACVLREMAADLEAEEVACEHHWLDRPESDTRECLICGTEVAG